MARSKVRKTAQRLVSFALALVVSLGAALIAQPLEAQAAERATVALWKALTPLKSVNTFMNTGAHPDDERSSVLAYVRHALGAHTISLNANRGEGGQNAIGTEYVHALGVVRTRELQEASEANGVELRFLTREMGDPIWDFGFSKSPEETLEQWGHELSLERLVRIIRETRPDVVMPSFLDSYGQHGHHRAMTVLTMEAYDAAADPNAFPEQIAEGLRPWQIKKVYLPAESGSGSVYADNTSLPVNVSVPVGEYDPILGASYVQLGEESRAYHKSQDMGAFYAEGPSYVTLHLAKASIPVNEQESSIFDGLPQTVADLAKLVSDAALKAKLNEVQAAIDAAFEAYPKNAEVAKALTDGLTAVREARALVAEKIGLEDELGYDIDFRLARKERQMEEALAKAVLLVTRLQASEYEVTRGATTTLTLTAFQGGQVPVEDVSLSLSLPRGWKATATAVVNGVDLAYNKTATAKWDVTIPTNAEYFDPYHPHEITGVIRFSVNGVSAAVTVEPQEYVAVLPDVALRTDPENAVINLDQPGSFTINVVATNYKAGQATTVVMPVLPEGWTAQPSMQRLSFARKGEVKSATFTITPPSSLQAGGYEIGFRAVGGASSDSSVQVIEYDHIGRTYMVEKAVVDVQAFPVVVPEGLRVGYVDGGSDSVPQYLRLIGVNVELLDESTLAYGDLSVYDTIVLGIRAYRTRPDLVAANSRLMEYVRNGGNLVVQYHQPGDNWNASTSAPYYLQPGSPSFNWRVTDENAEVTVLQPEHPLLTYPNVIGPEDWEGWVKERAVYIPSGWASEFTPVISMADPGEEPFEGTLLVANYGEGRYIYTSLVLYYQLEQNVPGAYRLFANLITPAR